MKVLFILNINIQCLGPSVHIIKDIVYEIAKDRENNVTIISKSFENTSEEQAVFDGYDNVNVVYAKSEVNKVSWVRRYIQDVKYSSECRKIYSDMKFDLVFLQSCNVAYFHVKKIRSCLDAKIVYNVQDIFPYNLKYIDKLPFSAVSFPIFCWLQRMAYKNVDKIITISEDMERLLRRDDPHNAPAVTIHNWGYCDHCVDIPHDKNIFEKEYNIERDKFNIIYAGNMGVVQNVEILVEAANILRNEKGIQFYLIGDGANKQSIVKYVEERRLDNVFFLQKESMAPYIYAAADVNIIPLAKGIIRTALPSKTPACLASGRCLIACIEKNSELGDILNNTDGCYVVGNDDANELAEEILRLFKQNKRFFADRTMALNTFSKVENPKMYVKEFEKILEDK